VLLAVLVGLVPCSTRPSERRCNVSHHQRCHNQGYRKNQKYALHYLSPPPLLAFPFSKNKTGHLFLEFIDPKKRWPVAPLAPLVPAT
jgi:hypothetical protein